MRGLYAFDSDPNVLGQQVDDQLEVAVFSPGSWLDYTRLVV